MVSASGAGVTGNLFLIPFKGRAGKKTLGSHAARRATAYDVGDLSEITLSLLKSGGEIGVHGIDAWHSADEGREELSRVAAAAGIDAQHARLRVAGLIALLH